MAARVCSKGVRDDPHGTHHTRAGPAIRARSTHYTSRGTGIAHDLSSLRRIRRQSRALRDCRDVSHHRCSGVDFIDSYGDDESTARMSSLTTLQRSRHRERRRSQRRALPIRRRRPPHRRLRRSARQRRQAEWSVTEVVRNTLPSRTSSRRRPRLVRHDRPTSPCWRSRHQLGDSRNFVSSSSQRTDTRKGAKGKGI